MASTRHRVSFPGVLKGQGHEATCTVPATRNVSLPETSDSNYIYSIPEKISEILPEGDYTLCVNGQRIPMRFQNGAWRASR